MGKVTLEIRNLEAHYFTPLGIIKAVNGVNFKIEEEEAIGIIGESGSGKSTTGWSILRLLPNPGKIVKGEIFYKNKNILKLNMKEMREIRGAKISMITQSAMNSLDPLMRVGNQITEAILVHEDVSEAVAMKRAKNLFENVGLETSRFKDYPHELSGGMKQRVMIAMALACGAGLIIADEPTTGLDVIVKAQILKLLDELRYSLKSSSIIFISHDLSSIVELCDKIIIMYGGKMMEYADTKKIIKKPLHPYTKGLLNSFPHIEEKEMIFESIPGNPPDMMNPPKGCMFHPRCKYATHICIESPPNMINVGDDHFVACYLVNSGAS